MLSLTRKFQGTNYRRTITGINYVIFTYGPGGAATTQKYSIPDQITVTGSTFPQLPGNQSPGVHAGAATSTSTFGFFVGGGRTPTDPTYRYAYSGDIITTSAPLGVATALGRVCAAGNAEVCSVHQGSSSATLATIRRFVYADEAVGNGTFLSRAVLDSSATGNKELSIFRNRGGTGGVDTDRFEFAPDTRTTGPALSNAGATGVSSTGNGTIGIIVGGFINFGVPGYSTNKLNFAANTCVLGTRLVNTSTSVGSMCGTTSTGVFASGSGAVAGVPGHTYEYASDVTALTAPDFGARGNGACANPVGVNV